MNRIYPYHIIIIIITIIIITITIIIIIVVVVIVIAITITIAKIFDTRQIIQNIEQKRGLSTRCVQSV